MSALDYLAWSIIAFVCAFGVIPMVGSAFNPSGTGYLSDLKIGYAIIAISGAAASVVWAIIRVLP